MSEPGPAAPIALPRTWRPRRARLVSVPVAVVAWGGALALAVALPKGWPVLDRLSLAIFGTIVGLVLLMLARPRLRADESGVLVVNLLRRRRLAWAEVVRVGFSRDDPWVFLDIADGTTIAVMALQSSDGERARRGARELAQLVRERAEAA